MLGHIGILNYKNKNSLIFNFLKFILLLIYLYFMYVDVLRVCMSMYHVHAHNSATGVTDVVRHHVGAENQPGYSGTINSL